MKLRQLTFVFSISVIGFTSFAFAQKAPPKIEQERKNRAEQPQDDGKLKQGGFSLKDFETSMFTAAQAQKMEEISRTRRGMIAKMEKLLRDKPLYSRKADIYFMLGEYYWQEAKYQFLKDNTKFEKKMEAYDNGTLKIKPTAPVQNLNKGLSFYRKVINQFPDYRRIDEVMYYLGRGALEQGKQAQNRTLVREGVQYFQKLVQNYPRSRFISQSHLSLGEHFFETDSLYYAKTNYEKIINNYPKSPMFNYALYKLGWVYFNLREFEKTVRTFQQVVENVSKAAGTVSFREQALNDLVKTYAEMDDSWRDALDYFKSVISKEADVYTRMEKLATLYVGFDKDKEALELFNHFIERTPVNPRVTEWIDQILEVRKKVNDFGKTEKEIRRILSYFKPGGRWMSANKNNDEAITEATRIGETNLLWLANHWHVSAEKMVKQGKKSQAAQYYKKAAGDYKIFLGRFPESKRAYFIRFYYAEILYHELFDYDEALTQYQRVINDDKKGKFIEDSALGVIYSSYELMVKAGIRKAGQRGKVKVQKLSEKELRQREKRKITKTPLHKLEKAYVAAADQYVDLLLGLRKDAKWRAKNPKRGEQIPEIMYLSAETFYRHGDFRKAVKRLEKIFEYDPNHRYAAIAVVTMIQLRARLRHWDKVEKLARELIKKRNFKYKTKKELRRYVAIAISEYANDLSKLQKHDQAIKESLRLVKEYKGEKELASKALMNVAVMYERAKRIKDAVKTYERVIREYKSQDVAHEAQYVIGMIYENQTRFEDAANAFLKMAKFKAKKQAPDAIANAGLIREAQKDYPGAIKAFQKWLKLWPKKDEAAKVYFKIGLLLERQGDNKSLKKAAKHYQNFAKKYGTKYVMKVEAYSRAGDIYRTLDERTREAAQAKWEAKGKKGKLKLPRRKNRKVATSLFEKSLGEFQQAKTMLVTLRGTEKAKKYASARYFAAQSAYWLAEYIFHDFDAARIPGTLKIKVLKKALTDKANLHQSAEQAFDKTLEFKAAHWLACTSFRVGLLYYNFAKELFDVPIPFGLTQEQEEEYQAALAEIGEPVQEKALNLLKVAIEGAHKKGVYNKCSKEAGIYAVKVNPEGFPIANEDQVNAKHTRDTLLSANFIRTLRRGNTAVDMLKKTTKDK